MQAFPSLDPFPLPSGRSGPSPAPGKPDSAPGAFRTVFDDADGTSDRATVPDRAEASDRAQAPAARPDDAETLSARAGDGQTPTAKSAAEVAPDPPPSTQPQDGDWPAAAPARTVTVPAAAADDTRTAPDMPLADAARSRQPAEGRAGSVAAAQPDTTMAGQATAASRAEMPAAATVSPAPGAGVPQTGAVSGLPPAPAAETAPDRLPSTASGANPPVPQPGAAAQVAQEPGAALRGAPPAGSGMRAEATAPDGARAAVSGQSDASAGAAIAPRAATGMPHAARPMPETSHPLDGRALDDKPAAALQSARYGASGPTGGAAAAAPASALSASGAVAAGAAGSELSARGAQPDATAQVARAEAPAHGTSAAAGQAPPASALREAANPLATVAAARKDPEESRRGEARRDGASLRSAASDAYRADSTTTGATPPRTAAVDAGAVPLAVDGTKAMPATDIAPDGTTPFEMAAAERAGADAPRGAQPSAPHAPQPQLADAPRAAMRQMAEAMHRAADGSVELTLNPEELGRVRLTLNGADGTMTVNIAADRPETLELMRRHADLLHGALRDLGYGEVKLDFGTRGDGRADQGPTDDTGAGDMQAGAADAADDAPSGPRLTASAGLDLRF